MSEPEIKEEICPVQWTSEKLEDFTQAKKDSLTFYQEIYEPSLGTISYDEAERLLSNRHVWQTTTEEWSVNLIFFGAGSSKAVSKECIKCGKLVKLKE